MIEKLTSANFYKSKALTKGLKFASEKSSLFTSTTSLLFASTLRPLSTLLTPKTSEDDKKISFVKSISSAINGFLFMLIASYPFSKAVKNIDKNPLNYLTKDTVKNLSQGIEDISAARSYKFLTQLFKLGLTFLLAYPKAITNNVIIPKIVNCNKKEDKPISFTSKLENLIADTINNKTMQNIAKKVQNTNYTTHLIALGDIFSTLAFTSITSKNKNLDKHQKKVLNYNALSSTALCLLFGYSADKLSDKSMSKFIENLKSANKNSPDLIKYIEGAKIAKTSLIFGLVYYGLIPMLSTFLSSKLATDNKNNI